MTTKFDYDVPGQYFVDGVIHQMPVELPDVLQKVKTFPLTPEDVVIATYRKAGSTWLCAILDLIYTDGDTEALNKSSLPERVRFMESNLPFRQPPKPELRFLAEQSSPRLMLTHLPYSYFERQVKEDKAKFIVVLRNPKDNLVSYFHFYRMNRGLGCFSHSWDDFFELVKAKKIVGGDYFDYNASWWPHRNDDNVLLMTYEDMKKDPFDWIKKISEFCGKVLSDETLQKITEATSFKKMQDNPAVNHAATKMFDQKVSKFMRKGEVGDWKNHFSEEQSQYIDQRMKETFPVDGPQFEYGE